MSEQEKTFYRGLVLRESLVSGELPGRLLPFVETEYAYLLDGKCPVTVIRLQVPASDVLHAAWDIALALRSEHYFANFIGTDDMLVAFPDTLVRIVRNAPTTAEQARSVGRHFGIPDHQMSFEAMFDHDHPQSMT